MNKTFGIVIIVFLIISCNASISSLQEVLTKELNSLSEQSEKNSITNTNNFANSDVQSQKRILDSTINLLIEGSNEIILPIDKIENINHQDYFKRYKDTFFLANLFVESPSKGSPLQYTYHLKKGEIFSYSIENVGKYKIEEISLVEGDAVRIQKNNFKKKDILTGVILLEEENDVTLNISNDNFFSNKGFFKTSLDIKIKKISPINFKTDLVSDTLFKTRNVVEVNIDTLYNVLPKNDISISPLLNISEKSNIRIPIQIPINQGNFLGWGYWINKSSESTPEGADQNEVILKLYGKQELTSIDKGVNLPLINNEQVSITVDNFNFDQKTRNYHKNFAFYKMNPGNSQKEIRAYVELSNQSKINPVNVDLYVVLVFSRKKFFDKTLNFYETTNSLKISLDNE